MKKLIITCLCALIGLCVHSQTQYINPFIGTQGMDIHSQELVCLMVGCNSVRKQILFLIV